MTRTFTLVTLALCLGTASPLCAEALPQSIPVASEQALTSASYREYATNGSLIGRGANQALFAFGLAKDSASHALTELTIDLSGTTSLKDVVALRLYRTKRADRFDPRSPGEELGRVRVGKNPHVSFSLSSQIQGEADALWVVADLSMRAKEGNQLTARLQRLVVDGQPLTGMETQAHTQGIVLQRSLLWAPGENGSKHYRIPGIVRLSDGTLVASIDKRKEKVEDLPANIDVEVKRSTDGGLTWSAPITIAEGSADHGYGDAAMATDGKTIYMVMVGGAGLWTYPSISKQPSQMYFTKSTDGGKTWLPVREITSEVYLGKYAWGGFFASGNGIITSTGRIVFVAAQREEKSWGGPMDNILVYSDDQGKTWQISTPARQNGDESKVVELQDGSLLVSSRNRASGANARTYILTRDGGKTWEREATWPELTGNACNGAFARYLPVGTKGKKSKYLLHTLPASATRDHLRLFLSQDEGKTWPISREICRGEAVYSEVVVFPDGTIGIISEENDQPGFDIYFTRVSLDWLLKGDRKR